MGVLTEIGVHTVNHFLPLHYLVFVARTGELLSKPLLQQRGYARSHYRSKSSHIDEQRGFGGFVHLTLHPFPPIVAAKLRAGFPHIVLEIPSHSVCTSTFDLCRFNVAMTRKLRRGEKIGHVESSTTGRYYDGLEIPVARSDEDKRAMLLDARGTNTMIEVLVPTRLALPQNTVVHCYSHDDAAITSEILATVGSPWDITCEDDAYEPNPEYAAAVRSFVRTALADPEWKGNGLEFDRV